MRRRLLALLLSSLWLAAPCRPAQEPSTCGTYRDKGRELLQLHRRALQLRAKAPQRALAAPRSFDIGDIAIIEDDGGLVSTFNAFDLDFKTLTFTLTTGTYSFAASGNSFDQPAATAGALLVGLADDDTREVALPFTFPFYGNSYQKVFVNSDGNLTFGGGDVSTADRSLGRMTSGAPRIAPLFDDLDPSKSSQGIFVLSEPGRMVITWAAVPETGSVFSQTFQVRLYPDGKIEFAYAGVSTNTAVVGLSPGGGLGTTAVVSFANDDSDQYAGTVAERFSNVSEVDVYATAKRFYATHEDAYDYLVIYNNMGVAAAPGALAYEITARNIDRSGYGDPPTDAGAELGSAHRLQAVLNMGFVQQYPADPNARVPGRGTTTGDTPMTILGHEAGHLFLAFASVRDPQNPNARPMLKPDGAHWSFNFNSDASLMEGNRIRDNGNGSFLTTGTVEGYSLLDQYLMGLVPADQVPPSFYVAHSSSADSRFSQVGVSFTGVRHDVHIEDLVSAEGRRIPGPAVSQRHFHFAFILVVPQGVQPADADLQRLNTFRGGFPDSYSRFTGNRAFAETTLQRAVRLSVAPAAGLVAGSTVPAVVSIDAPAASPLTVTFDQPALGFFDQPSDVIIPAGATSATFQITGRAPGEDDLVARAADPQFEIAWARIRVSGTAFAQRLSAVAGSGPQLALKITDSDNLPYPGRAVVASAAGGGTVSPPQSVSDTGGVVSLDWNPGTGGAAKLTVTVQGATPGEFGAVVNAASYLPGLTPGAFAAVFGSHMAGGGVDAGLLPYPEELAGVRVTVDSAPAVLHYASDGQINLVLPSTTRPGTSSLAISSPAGTYLLAQAPVLAAAPGIFFDPFTGFGAVVRTGNVLDIYATGIGTGFPVTVNLGGSKLTPTSAGPSSIIPGLDHIQVQIPSGLAGDQVLSIEVNGRRSNEVFVRF